MTRPRRWRRIAARIAAWFVGVLVALVVAALLCVNLPFARRLIAKEVTAMLDGVLVGKIVIDHVGSVGLTRVGGVKAHLTDASGRTVIAASGVSARLRTFTLVKSLLGKSGLDVHLDSVSIDHVDALLDTDRDGDLFLVKALASPPSPPSTTPEKPSTLNLAIDEARLDSGWLHGLPSPGFAVDADLRDMRLGVTFAGGKTTLALRRLGVETRAMPSNANPHGNLTAHVVLPPAPQTFAAKATFDGKVADASTKVEGALSDDHLEAHFTADAPPSSLKQVVPSLALRQPARVRLDAKGTLPDVHTEGTVVTGPSVVTLTADAVVGKPLHGHLQLAADHVDLAGVLQGAPKSDLNARLRANVTVPAGGMPTGSFSLETKPARLAEQHFPALTADGKLTGVRGSMTLDVAEPGTKTRVTLDLNLHTMEVGYDASISIPDFTRFERLPGPSTGSASVRARGTAYLTTSTVSGDVRARVANVDSNGVRVRKADVGAVVSGPFSKPDVDAKVVAVDVVGAGRAFDAAAVSARGNAGGFSLGAHLDGANGAPDATVSTRVALGRGITLSGLEAHVGDADDRVRVHADTVWSGGGVVAAEGVTIDGAGAALSAAARVASNAMDVRAVSAGVDLGKLARALGVAKKDDVRGKLALDVDLKTRGRTAHGKVGVELSDAAYAGIHGVGLRMASSVDGRRFNGSIRAQVDGGHVDVDAQDLTLADSLFSPRAWERASGRVRIDSEVDLARLAQLLSTGMLPFDDMAGKVVVSGELTRGAGDTSPETTWQIHTDGVRASAKSESERPHDGTKVRSPPRWRIGGVDVDGSLSIAKERGQTAVSMQFRDALGPLAKLDAMAELPYRDFVAGTVSVEALESAPFQVRFALPSRRLSKLPPIFATAGVDGDVQLTVEASATARDPIVKLDGAVRGLSSRGRQKAKPIDVRIEGDYGDGFGKLSLDVDTSAKKAVSIDSEVHAKVSDLLDHSDGDWDASVKGKLDTFPLDVLSIFGLRRIKGTVSGDLDAATGTHVEPHARAKLNADGVAMARDQSGGARAMLDADADDHGLNAKIRFDQPDGFAEATASAGLTWSGPLSPTLDPSKGTAKAAVSAKHFRLSALQPLVQTILADLDGRLDANAHLEASALHGAPKLDGQLVVDQATFEVTSAAQQFHDVHADVVLQQDGTLRADNVSARGLTGSLTASGLATLDGLSLKRAKLSAKIPSGDPFPVAVQGQSFAKASGNFEIEVVPVPQKQELDVTLNVPSAKVTLFDRPTRDLQVLDKDERIRIGYHRTPGEFVVVPLERPARLTNTEGPPTTVVATVNLRDVEVMRGTDLRARLEGQPKIRLAETTSMSGEIHLHSGYLYVQGKKFEIEQGTITFIGEPDNPNVVVTAGWTAPEGTRVFADFVGPLKSGKVTLRSEPVHTKNEILSLILFGTPDGMGASSNNAGTAGTAVGVAGGVATQGLNKAIDDITGMDITTRIDTSDSSNPRPEVEVRVARDVTVAISHVIGVPPPGTNPDMNYATVNWRFRRNWSLDTTIGDQGSSLLDLVWTYRY